MKILLCTSTFDTITHGPAKFAQLLLRINQFYPEHEVRILTEDVNQQIPNTVYKISPKYWRPFHAFWPFLNNYSYYQAVKGIQEEFLFDVLIFNNALMGYWCARQKRRRWRVLGLVNDDDYLSANFNQILPFRKWAINIHRKVLEKLSCRSLDAVLCNSDYIRSLVINTYSIPEKNVLRLYKSIDLKPFAYRESINNNLNCPIQILFVKSDFPRGGLRILIDALGILKYEFELVIIGPKMKFESEISSYCIDHNNIKMNFLGPCEQDRVIQEMNCADIFCVPAHKEGLGIANIEALAIGVPVVSTPVGGIPEVLDHGKNGWLSTTDSKKALAIAIRDCIESPEERLAKSIRGRRFVEKKFNHKLMIEEFLKILQDTIDQV